MIEKSRIEKHDVDTVGAADIRTRNGVTGLPLTNLQAQGPGVRGTSHVVPGSDTFENAPSGLHCFTLKLFPLFVRKSTPNVLNSTRRSHKPTLRRQSCSRRPRNHLAKARRLKSETVVNVRQS